MGFWGWTILIVVIVVFVGAVFQGVSEGNKNRKIGKANGYSPMGMAKHGEPKPQMICPHCQSKGRVLTKPVNKKNGISGAKATGAVLTGGVSVLATGLSQKDTVTEAHCTNCSSTWLF
ncbi:hypothetical protein [Shimia thalassica]|uniref:hypothetical protein n=1 Tax=Shimia thalassica TaxID=1715693 RepID=UPI0026E2536E|nr:hypothetical protein [Shimia thalassica]MDO6483101.1 hypothetical protein [Shimia thalassica]